MPFKKGQSGNPGGREKVKPATRRALRELLPVAIARLKRILEDEESPAASAVAAARDILDRNLGKPVQSVEVNDGRKPAPRELGDAELADIASRGSTGTPNETTGTLTVQ